ncbi:site-specific integrase [Novosphingobium sp. LASN5T]|uniref:tyrosine-type recombinase/integrase n=1 Tax=Novosphingobium sp. LASN5T TaxID=2491021 RepID=UPI000F5D7E0C|nr:site-specific integrase [Novosphingobium sp. LASN5T]MBS0503090.1 integrase arm-type DNA-binding domain-containing protein [Pseudomonadota bacterium]RQW38850.1 site-specific integrase [Novosphingobium sp. LASN5T]
MDERQIMPNQSITLRTIQSVTPDPHRDIYVWDPRLKGFGLRITPRGAQSFVFQYRVDGGPARRKTIGPVGSPWTPATARKEAERLLVLVYQGIDPVEAKREAKRKKETLNFRTYSERFVELYLKPNWRGTWGSANCTIHNVFIPRWGNRPVHEITRADIVKVLDEYSDRPARRKEIHSLLRKFFNWATDRQDIDVSPLAGMKAPKAVPSRRRVLSDDEVVALWRATENSGWPWGPFVRMLILTMQRRQEVAEMDWSEIDIDARRWTLPADRAKNDQEHVIPLTSLALAELQLLGPKRKGLVFTTTGTTPVSGFFKGRAALHKDMIAHLKAKQIEDGGDPDQVDVPNWRLHDIRRTGATHLQSLRVPVEVTESVLNHISGTRAGVAGIYNRYKYDDEKRTALDAWDAKLRSILST